MGIIYSLSTVGLAGWLALAGKHSLQTNEPIRHNLYNNVFIVSKVSRYYDNSAMKESEIKYNSKKLRWVHFKGVPSRPQFPNQTKLQMDKNTSHKMKSNKGYKKELWLR